MSPADRASPPPAHGSPTRADDPISLARMRRLRDSLAERGDALAELIDLFLGDLPRRIAAIAAAVERTDAAAIAFHAHALRSGAGNFGASVLDDVCGQLEQAGLCGALEDARAAFAELAREGERVRRALVEAKAFV